jgi:hypothetical protein
MIKQWWRRIVYRFLIWQNKRAWIKVMHDTGVVMSPTLKTLAENFNKYSVEAEFIDVSTYGDKEPVLLCCRERTPDEGAQAARDWDAWFESAQLC